MSRDHVQIKIGGSYDGESYVGAASLTDLGYYGNVTYTERWSGGPWVASWQMNLPRGFHSPLLYRGSLVQIFEGPTRRWLGELSEPDWANGRFHARGIGRATEYTPALNFDNVTSSPGDAIYYAHERGEIRFSTQHVFNESDPWSPTAPPTDNINTIAGLLNAYTASEAQSWWVDSADGLLKCAADPTEPMWWAAPGAGRLGVADEDYVTRLWFRYANMEGGYSLGVSTDDSANRGQKSRAVSLVNLGMLTSTRAQQIGDQMLAKLGARTGWTNGLTFRRGQIVNQGSVVVDLGDIKAGHMMRLPGLVDERGQRAHTDIVLEEVTHRVSDGEIDIRPEGMAARDFDSIVEKMGGELL